MADRNGSHQDEFEDQASKDMSKTKVTEDNNEDDEHQEEHTGSSVKSRYSEREPGSLDLLEPPPPESEDGTSGSSNTEPDKKEPEEMKMEGLTSELEVTDQQEPEQQEDQTGSSGKSESSDGPGPACSGGESDSLDQKENSSLQSKEAHWKKFSIIQTGKTNGAHKPVVKTFKSLGQTEVNSPQDADYCLVFCPVSSRVGTDVSYAIERLPGDKKAILVVMHHTFNREQVIPQSSRLVDERRVPLTLDCLFYQDKLLKCELNGKIKADIKKFFRSKQTDSSWTGGIKKLFGDPFRKPKKPLKVVQAKDRKSANAESQSDVAEWNQDSSPPVQSQSSTGPDPADGAGELEPSDLQEAPPPRSEEGENGSSNLKFSQQTDSSWEKESQNLISKEMSGTPKNFPEHEEVKDLQSENAESQSDVAERNEDGGPPVQSQSSTSSVPGGSAGEPEPSDLQEAPPPESEEGAKGSTSMKFSSTWKDSQNLMSQLMSRKPKKVKKSQSNTSSVPGGSAGEPGPSDLQEVSAPHPPPAVQNRNQQQHEGSLTWRINTTWTRDDCHE